MFSRVDSFYRAVIARGSGGRALRSRTGVHVTETQSQTVPVGCRRGTAVYSRSLLALSRMLSRLGFTTGRDTEDRARHTDHRGCGISDLASRFLARRSRIGIRMPCPRVTRRPVAPCARRAARRDVEGGGGHAHDRHPCDTEIRTPRAFLYFLRTNHNVGIHCARRQTASAK